MICFVCKHGETRNGTTSVTLERGNTTLVIKDVPALICANCGETNFDSDVTDAVLNLAVEGGVQLEVRAYPLAQAA